MQKPSLLADLVDIRYQLGLDQEQDRKQIADRDREIGRSVDAARGSDASLLRRWVAAIRRQTPMENGWRAQRGANTLVTAIWLIGILAGWLLGRAVLQYDGSEPVNIISALVILVIAQLTGLALMVILLAGGFERVREALLIVNPAVWIARFISRIQPAWEDRVNSLLDERGSLADHGVRRWYLVYVAQHFTVALNLGIIAVLLYLVAVSDLAFGWNTTLAVENDAVYHVFRTLSSPWQWALPAASPNAELVEISRYYRLEATLREGPVDAPELGTWWLFLLMCVIVYGLLPRLIMLVYSGSRLDASLLGAIRASAGSGQVLARMRSPLVVSRAPSAEGSEDVPAVSVPLRGRQTGRPLPCVVVEWSGANAARDALERAGIDPLRFYPAGGHQSMKDDRALLEQISNHKPEAVALVVRSWEPPMLDFVDLVRDIRQHTGERCLLLVLLLPVRSGGPVHADHLESWESSLYALNDAALFVEALR